MTILASDIKLLKSERMSDAADGGGRMTSTVVPDGVAGSVFPKVSRLDAVYGRVNLRKIYAAVQSALTETYGGAHTIITDGPDNALIGCVLFSTGSHFDDRSAARDRIESYVVAGPLSRMRLYGSQVVGQRALLLYQRTDEPLPDVGQVLCLSVEAAGYAAVQQYLRIDEVSHEVRTFTDTAGDFARRVIAVKVTTPLIQTFVGAEPSRYSGDGAPTKVRDTQVADSSRYYGIQPLTEAALAGDLAVKLATIYAPLVPSTQRETSVSMVQVSGAGALVASGPSMSFSWVALWVAGQTATRYLPTGVLPGTFRFTGNIQDDGAGKITGDYGTTGSIDYATGAVTMTYAPQSSGNATSATVTYTPAVQVATQSHTVGVPVTLGTRGLVYNQTLNPLPGVGAVVVDYRALGKWYRLRDNGAGLLVGASAAEGTGSVAYASGAVVVTLGALPDVDSEVIFTWASTVHFTMRAGGSADNPTRGWQLRIPLANAPVKPGSVTVRWRAYVGDPERTYTDPTGTGTLTPSNAGATPGTINYVTGEIVLQYGQNDNQGGIFPGTDMTVTVEYQQELPSGATPLVTTDTLAVTTPTAFNCGRTSIAPKSFRMTFPLNMGVSEVSYQATVVDDGAGNLITLAGNGGSGWSWYRWWLAGQQVGTINYSSGAVTLSSVGVKGYSYGGFSSMVWLNTAVAVAPLIGDFTISSKAAASTYSAKTETLAVSTLGLTYDLTTTTAQAVVPGSVYLDFFADKYIDRGGKLYRAFSTSTAAASEAGTINYDTGEVRITAATYGNIGRNSGTPVAACLTTYGEFTTTEIAFRTAGSPLRPGSLYVQAYALDGTLCSGTSDTNGVITGSHVRGTVKSLTGVAHVEFGDLVSGEWVRKEVFPSTIRYSCVVLSNLPLDASILGLDPVRLPSDGRVPVVRPGDVAVVHHTGTVTLTNPATAGSTVSAGRTGCSLLELRDATGQRIPDALYTRDLAAGTVTLATPLDLSGYTQPLALRHRIEDMALVSDVQINGAVSLAAPLTHAYPSSGAYLSTALLAGDLAARVEKLFDQATWTSVWSDALIGNEAAGQYNDLQYPIAVTNAGAIKERWRAQVTALSPLTVSIYGEGLGLIGSFNATATIAPVNPLSGVAYFTLQPGGWGAGGWAIGNVLRFNTVGANYPIWIARTVLGGASLSGDSFDLATRGDID